MSAYQGFLSHALGVLFVIAFVSIAIMLAVGAVDEAKTRFWAWFRGRIGGDR